MALKLYIEDGQAKAAAKYVDDASPPSGYTDKDGSATDWDKAASRAGLDYLFIKSKIKPIIEITAGADYSTFASLTQTDKDIAVKWLSDHIKHADFTSEAPLLKDRKAIIVRDNDNDLKAYILRTAIVVMEIKRAFKKPDIKTTFVDLGNNNLVAKFQLGLDALRKYIDGVAPFAGTGLRDSLFTPKGSRTLDQVCDDIIEVIDNGF